ncbi:hypothetical protein Misp01_11890 [Microtetraspora sp. NBRC 13810]|uniref:DUF6879 family protein n=1 Tax=Microtetraspora sp. NBRC 13810 TaxID=3030990 RepID=UPI0024A48591|nr:DUF6879 family protein [Microtetraspora sp. NBRC 13810]GLW06059.1 hypothetical protein Misp01_11890 [Microtetraspora sp. NBRC 13810]
MTEVAAPGAHLSRLIRDTPAAVLAKKVYDAEVNARVGAGTEPCWKLERMQYFREPDVPSWAAAREGDWARSRALIDGMRPALRAQSASLARLRRARIVERPVSPYLQWEMHVFLARTAAGETVRAVDAAALSGVEADGRLPEQLIVGSGLMYEILYDAAGEHTGARRIEAPGVIEACTAELTAIFAIGEPFSAYFAREIAPLPPPAGF